MPMNQEIKARWGEWLLAHESEQGTGALRQETEEGDRFCCLGGLCELATEAGIVERSFIGSRGKYSYTAPGDVWLQTGILPQAVMEWAGLNDDNPVVTAPDGERHGLASLNDRGMTFPEIWQLIDSQL